ncbi:MAG: hypothetical protein PHQ96_08645 [Candidatus Omnitrophica bacterium]|nr:hypothetical protein [Candidatus Omnitrophota bacterium]
MGSESLKRSGVIQVPDSWMPVVHREKLFWFWTPISWVPVTPISPEACLARRTFDILLEVVAMRQGEVPQDTTAVAATAQALVKSLKAAHYDLRILKDDPYVAPQFDKSEALLRMKNLGRLEGYEFVGEMLPSEHGHLLRVEYSENLADKSITDCYLLSRGNLTLMLNMKTLSLSHLVHGTVFEQVAACVMLGSIA